MTAITSPAILRLTEMARERAQKQANSCSVMCRGCWEVFSDPQEFESHSCEQRKAERQAKRAEQEDLNRARHELLAGLTRDVAIERIRKGLKSRSGKSWSVRGGTGSSWGWIYIDAPPARRTYDDVGNPAGRKGALMGPQDREELGRLLGFDRPAGHQGVYVAADSTYYREYIDRAEGREPSIRGEQYWD